MPDKSLAYRTRDYATMGERVIAALRAKHGIKGPEEILALAGALHIQLVTQIGSVARKVHAFGFEAFAQLVNRELVLSSDGLQGPIEFGVFNARAVFTGKGQYGALIDERFGHLPLEIFFGRQLDAQAQRLFASSLGTQ